MTRDLYSDKAQVRQKILSARLELTTKEIRRKSTVICKKVLALKEIKASKNFLIYLPINNEVDTKPIVDYLKKAKKKIFLPKFSVNKWKIVEFVSRDYLEQGPFGILQPKANKLIDVSKIDIALVPGVAFDKMGVRLGYGKGVYDRLLANFEGLKIGLTYDFQIVDRLPYNPRDIKVDIVIKD